MVCVRTALMAYSHNSTWLVWAVVAAAESTRARSAAWMVSTVLSVFKAVCGPPQSAATFDTGGGASPVRTVTYRRQPTGSRGAELHADAPALRPVPLPGDCAPAFAPDPAWELSWSMTADVAADPKGDAVDGRSVGVVGLAALRTDCRVGV
eukprot:CAMPEP_0181182496 /NCGR_PEP_ID=MMETSP1096-20121128/7922_1 /TAXON_ID=156174 ORGANISM="Chrysochromulina ericina, Strain CCMP281" /NCGR_SAMPLE_ID=MMETSP1096 /ASSEMBLY_ACC=CAM_ASM_000453 /LENGTH=150 /DNA_ID=CAMNT_0023271111 /DNA_START=138 /DNA_END=591 /DNA_ORIENTATION=-